MTLTPRVEDWRDAGETTEFRGRRIFVRRRAGAGVPMLVLHGFPSSSYDFRGLFADGLPAPLEGRPLVAFDFLGFGLSEKPRDHEYTLAWQADLATEMVRRYAAGGPVEIVAHDMGTSVATELMAREIDGRPGFAAERIVLFNGSILLHLADPILGQHLLRSRFGPLLARLSNRAVFVNQLGSVFTPEHPLSREEAADQWALTAAGGGNRLGHKLIGYMDERTRFADRWHGAIAEWPGDLRFIWALQDRVANVAVFEGLRALRPGAPVFELPRLGHYPQIEDPQAFAQALAGALE